MSAIPRLMRNLGWVAFALMWIPFMLMFINMPSGNNTYDSFADLPNKMGLYLVITIAMSIFSMLLIFGSVAVGWLLGRIILSRGDLGFARIIDIRPTGTRVNRYYYGMRFILEVQSAFGETFQADSERLVPMHEMNKYQVGMMVQVKYDPFLKLVAIAD